MKKYLSKLRPKRRIREEGVVPSAIAAPLDALDRGPSDAHGRIREEVFVPSAIETAAPLDSPAHVHHRLPQFRILVMGRANAGKTTLLQRVCNTTEDPEVFDGQGNRIDATVVEGCLEQGEHEIENELIFKSNAGFVFHDSSGFEAGSEEEFNNMKKFVTDRGITRELQKRIHAIWFCIPTTDHERMVTAAEEKFFDECNTGHVPVIVILTKCDTLRATVFNELRNKGFSREEARERAGEQAENMREKLQGDIRQKLGKRTFPPKDYLLLAKMNEVNTDCGPLLKTTATALNEESLKQLLISTQRTNLVLCIEYAVKELCDKTKMDKWKGTLDEKKALQGEVLRWFPYYRWRRFRRNEERFERFREWFRNFWEFERFEERNEQIDPVLDVAAVDELNVPLVSQALTMSLTQHILTFGISVILVAEYAYFFMQKRELSSKNVFASAAQQYYSSGIQIEVQKAIAHAVDQNSNDMEQLCHALFMITMAHRMSNKLLN